MAAFDDKFAIRLILIVILVVVLVVLVTQYNKKVAAAPVEAKTVDQYYNSRREHFADAPLPAAASSAGTTVTAAPSASASAPTPGLAAPVAVGTTASVQEGGVMSSEPGSNEDYMAIDFEVANKTPGSCFPRDTNTPEDLIPKGAANSKWAQVMPAGQGDVKDQNFLTAGHHIGINTVGQSMRNANWQLRSDPPVPKAPVGPWMQSTIEYDNSRRHFEIGQC